MGLFVLIHWNIYLELHQCGRLFQEGGRECLGLRIIASVCHLLCPPRDWRLSCCSKIRSSYLGCLYVFSQEFFSCTIHFFIGFVIYLMGTRFLCTIHPAVQGTVSKLWTDPEKPSKTQNSESTCLVVVIFICPKQSKDNEELPNSNSTLLTVENSHLQTNPNDGEIKIQSRAGICWFQCVHQLSGELIEQVNGTQQVRVELGISNF